MGRARDTWDLGICYDMSLSLSFFLAAIVRDRIIRIGCYIISNTILLLTLSQQFLLLNLELISS